MNTVYKIKNKFFKKLVKLNVMVYRLPISKVEGKDMFGRKTKQGGFQAVLNAVEHEAQEALPPNVYNHLLECVQNTVEDLIQKIQDQEEGLFINEQVDNPIVNYAELEAQEADDVMNLQRQAEAMTMSVADEAQTRHDRMVYRLAIVDKLKAEGKGALASEVNDSLVDRLLNAEQAFDESLLPFVVEQKDLLRKEKEILTKNQAAYKRSKLERKAHQLRELCHMAEHGSQEEVKLAIKMANKVKLWCEQKQPYSKRSVDALYNEAIHTLVALGKFKVALVRREWNTRDRAFTGEECSFFLKKTAEEMVEVKTGLDWNEEVATLFYEQGNGNTVNTVELF